MSPEDVAEGLMQILMGSGWSEELRDWPISGAVLARLRDLGYADTRHDGRFWQPYVTPAGLAFLETYKDGDICPRPDKENQT